MVLISPFFKLFASTCKTWVSSFLFWLENQIRGAGTDFLVTVVPRQYISLIPRAPCSHGLGSPRSVVPVGEPPSEAGAGAGGGWASRRLAAVTLLLLPPGTEAGPPGPRGPPAAPRVASASRCGSGPAATPPRGTGAACAWGRTARRGGYLPSVPPVASRPLPVIPVQSVSLRFQFLDPAQLVCGILFCWAEWPSSFVSSFNFDQSLGWTASLVGAPRGLQGSLSPAALEGCEIQGQRASLHCESAGEGLLLLKFR